MGSLTGLHKEVDTLFGITGIEFIEYTSPNPARLRELFHAYGMKEVGKHPSKKIFWFKTHDVNFLINEEPGTFADEFKKSHGPSICSMGWRVTDANKAFELAVSRGARPFAGSDSGPGKAKIPAVYGIGDSLIYFIDRHSERSFLNAEYTQVSDPGKVTDKGLLSIDHLTNNVPRGEMDKWCEFYRSVFGFREVRYFDIKGLKTGLVSKVMVSPGYKIIIPINEPTDSKSQIQEYLEEYHGSGIQHVAFLTKDAIKTVQEMGSEEVEFLDAPPTTYYEALKDRVPLVKEDPKVLQRLSLLADGDEAGYLLQIFTKNQIGPIFYEIIQRENHWGFGEGNFQALFDSIERDQMKRGYLK